MRRRAAVAIALADLIYRWRVREYVRKWLGCSRPAHP
jgi:hypothetical protein